ncbi:hypothetical protein AOLI_G00218390 [Acnodon oligacanthus]
MGKWNDLTKKLDFNYLCFCGQENHLVYLRWEKWRVVCLATLSVEDIEDIYLFGTMITGVLLIGLGIALLFREIREMGTAVQGPLKLPDMIDAVGRAVSIQTVTLNRNMENILEKLSALQREMDHFGDQTD